MSLYEYYSRNPELREYFLSLPAGIQSKVIETGVEIASLGELQLCVQNMIHRLQG